jgi:hypothetical protein|tara:strand:+ start:260 stop:1177 length:918 start_codon:yes stop_codon:yes gene_type:complete
MGNTTFSGPVRSENGFSLVSKNGTTGLIQDRTLGGDAARDTRRYFLYEPFLQRPALNAVINTAFSNADATNAANTAIRLAEKVANRNFEVLGTNMTTALCTFNATSAGIVLTTATADQDQAIVTPHLDTNQTAWQVTKWGTENQVEWECSINTNAIDNQKLWAGIKLTNDQLVATDADQAYFKFQTDATNSEAFTDFTVWHFIYSVGGTDYISALPITVAANTIYHLRISIDSDRKASIFVNGVQYNVTSTSGSTGGTAVTTGTTKSLALTDDVDLIPYIGIEAGAAAAEAVDVQYQSISRVIFE